VAAGDGHRVWFPEMVEHLRLRWRDDLSMEALLELRYELDDMDSLDAAHLQPGLQVSGVRAHRAWRRSARQCSRHDIGAGSLPRGRERTGTGA
jgi:hypothetical protein